MYSNGGWSIKRRIHGSLAWPWIISLFQVCVLSISLFFSCLFLATSVDVERLFSKGHLLLSHVCSCLSVQLICALLCLNSWSLAGLVKDEDVLQVVKGEPEIAADEDEPELKDGWYRIHVDTE